MFTEAKLKSGLESLGLKFKTKTRPGTFSAAKDGLRIDITQYSNRIQCLYCVRTEAGGYARKLLQYHGFELWLTKIRKDLKTLKPAPKTKRKAEPPSVLQFVGNPKDPKERFSKTEFTGEPFSVRVTRMVAATPQIHWISSVEIVQMDGTLLNAEAHDPDKKLWFHMGCANHLNATFDIITDGERFIPVDRYRKKDGKFRTTRTTCPKASVNLKHMNQDDKEIINFAIQAYMEGQCE